MDSFSVGINLHRTFEFNEALKIYGRSEPCPINCSLWNDFICVSVAVLLPHLLYFFGSPDISLCNNDLFYCELPLPERLFCMYSGKKEILHHEMVGKVILGFITNNRANEILAFSCLGGWVLLNL